MTAQLLHAPTDRHLWAKSYEADDANVLTLQSELAQAIAGEIRGKADAPRAGAPGHCAAGEP